MILLTILYKDDSLEEEGSFHPLQLEFHKWNPYTEINPSRKKIQATKRHGSLRVITQLIISRRKPKGT